MNFCAAILILKMEEEYNIFGVFCFIMSRKIKTQLFWNAKKKKICTVFGEDAVTDLMCQKWFVKFLGTIDIWAKQFFAVGLPYSLEDV